AAAGGRPAVDRSAMRRVMALVAAVVALAALAGIGGTAAVGAQVTADEPYYLMTAGSLYHRQDLDIGPDLRAESYRAYHRAELPEQTAALPNGQRLSPHDPLLPAILAVPFGLGGWFGAKLAMVATAAALAALLVWTATVRFGVPLRVAGVVVAGFGVVPPLAAYGTQVYPELPAALAVTVAVAALTGTPSRRAIAVWVIAAVALPWLAVKYAPVALALVMTGLGGLGAAGRRQGPASDATRHGRALVVAVGGLAVAAVAFGAFHQSVYGGWTVYAAGNHFTGGELTVMGESPDYASRSQRLVNLLTDHDFGLLAWAPAFVAAVPAAAALVRRRPPGWLALGLPLGAGWLNATFVALTMHGWWWPGRQVVVVVPLIILLVAWWVGTVLRWERVRPWFLAASAHGLLAWLWLQAEVARGTSTVIIDFARTTNPLSRAWRLLLPDGRVLGTVDHARLAAWALALTLAAVWSWRRAGPDAQATAAEG
ncbi:MAG: hypothetical protein JWM47_1492, partial [Acidimicrobiales bacterium]|nr:hypothetical protein [Acidimicrobiales bacterium]